LEEAKILVWALVGTEENTIDRFILNGKLTEEYITFLGKMTAFKQKCIELTAEGKIFETQGMFQPISLEYRVLFGHQRHWSDSSYDKLHEKVKVEINNIKEQKNQSFETVIDGLLESTELTGDEIAKLKAYRPYINEDTWVVHDDIFGPKLQLRKVSTNAPAIYAYPDGTWGWEQVWKCLDNNNEFLADYNPFGKEILYSKNVLKHENIDAMLYLVKMLKDGKRGVSTFGDYLTANDSTLVIPKTGIIPNRHKEIYGSVDFDRRPQSIYQAERKLANSGGGCIVIFSSISGFLYLASEIFSTF
jgi:hypothetical protein